MNFIHIKKSDKKIKGEYNNEQKILTTCMYALHNVNMLDCWDQTNQFTLELTLIVRVDYTDIYLFSNSVS